MEPDTLTAPTEPSTAPPGWYPDPIGPGGRRWWDGTQWALPEATTHAPTPAAGSKRAGALIIVAVAMVVTVIAGSRTLWHLPTVHLDTADALQALPSNDQVADVYGDGMTITRKVTATTAKTTGAAESSRSSCGTTPPPSAGKQGGAELEANGTNPKRKYEVTSYVYDTEVHAEAATTGTGANLRSLATCMSSRWPDWQITSTDTTDGVEVRLDDGNANSVIAVTRIGNVVLSVAASGTDDSQCERAVNVARAAIDAPPGH